MGSNVLKYTRDTSLWLLLNTTSLAPVGHKVQLKKSCGRAYHTRPSPCRSKSVLTLKDSTGDHVYHTWYNMLLWYCKTIWYHIWYHSLNYDIRYDIIVKLWYHRNLPIPCAIFLWFWLWYHSKNIHFWPWYQVLLILLVISRYFSYEIAYDISYLWYWRCLISYFSWYRSLYHGTWAWYLSLYHGTWATWWRWLGAPRASRSSSSCLAVANVLGTGVELNGDGLDPIT